MTNDVYVIDVVRTPIGRYGGALADTRPDDLAAHVVASLTRRTANIDPAWIDDVVLGAANGAGEDNRDVARMAVLLAGLPESVPGVTVNRLCGSGLEAITVASRAIAAGDASICIAGGVESMSRAPWILPKPSTPYPRNDQALHSTTLGWRMINPAMPAKRTLSLGECTEILADKFAIGRDAQDEFALESHIKAHNAWEAKLYADETAPVPGIDLERDESIRPDTSVEKLAVLRPAFHKAGTVTAGNASPLNDGAAAVLLADTAGMERIGAQPLARIAANAVCGVDPQLFGIGPVHAAQQAREARAFPFAEHSSEKVVSRKCLCEASVRSSGVAHIRRTETSRAASQCTSELSPMADASQ